MKDGKLKSKDFFEVENDPLITFHSKVEQTGPDTIVFDGDFTIRGVTKQEKLTFAIEGQGTGAGTVKGTMALDRKDYRMNEGIPLVKIADRVEVTVDLKAKRVSGPPIASSNSHLAEVALSLTCLPIQPNMSAKCPTSLRLSDRPSPTIASSQRLVLEVWVWCMRPRT